MPFNGISVYSRSAYILATASADALAGIAAAVGAAAETAAGAALAPSTSALTMRPRGPEPDIVFRSMPLSAAMRRAKGEANTRLPSLAAGAAGAAAGVAADAEMSPALSPSSKRTAMTAFTLTPSVPSAIMILLITPSSTASNSIVALSVSISASRSPEDTMSPSLTNHLVSVPSSMVGESAGMRISIGMSAAPYL